MTRRRCGLVVATAALVAVMGCGQRATAPDVPADVLIVTLDTARADRFSYTGRSPVTTPSVDRIAAEGAAFLTAVAPSPITLVSHASLFTGQDPYAHGVHNNGDFALAPEAVTLAEVFADGGWATAAFVGATVLDKKYGLAQGFSTYDDRFSGTDTSGSMAYARRRGDKVVEAALRWLKEAPPGPTFVWVHLYDPHAPYEPPEPERSRYPDNPYNGAIAFTDRMVGRLLNGYRHAGRYENALVVVVADHGESLGEHGEKTHGVFIYDATVRIPFVMRGPGIAPGSTIDEPVALIDVMPTVVESVRLDGPSAVMGRNLWPLLEGGAGGDADRAMYIESLLPELSFGWSPLHGLRNSRWKFIRGTSPELYDLAADPSELADVAALEPMLVQEMSQQLDATLASVDGSTATDIEIDDVERARLAALGYISLAVSDSGGVDVGELPDPRERIAVLQQMHAAIIRFDAGDDEGAIADLENLLLDEPDNHSVQATLGSLKFRVGDFDGAASAYRRAAGLAPRHANYSELEALSLERLGRLEEAIGACGRALAADPDRISARDMRWRLLSRVGKVELLIQETEQAVAEDPEDGMARALLERARHGFASSALVQALERALAENPGDAALTATLADTVYSLGDRNRADLLYRQVLEQRPDNLNAALRVGRRALEEGRISDAAEVITVALRHHHDSAALQVLVARTRTAAGDYEAAKMALVEAYRVKPGWAETWLAAGELGIAEGLPAQAAANLDRAAAAAGDDPDLWHRLAEANRRLGREDEAAAARARARHP